MPSMAVADDRQLSVVQHALEQVRADRALLESRMRSTQSRIESLYERQAQLEAERDDLERQFSQQLAEAVALEDRMTARIRQSYMHGSAVDPVAVFFSSEDPAGALAKAETIRWLVAGDRTRIEELAAARTRAASSQLLLDARIAELDRLGEDFSMLTKALEDDLVRAQRLEVSLDAQVRAELERQERQRRQEAAAAAATAVPAAPVNRTATTLVSSGSAPTACPIDQPHNFIDSWGHPRSGGRRHRGTDLMAPHGLTLRAITDGVWEHQRPGRSAGIWGVLRGDDGATYRYLHLSAHTAHHGERVTAGQEVGRNGSTGNASTPHLHFEAHPGGASAVNPYPLLRSLCG
ncbi:MAG: peptidoglycan DD-metalloendopeptidase family protein [Nitriliruptoraceae bacterium]